MNPWRGLRGLPREVWFLCLATLINRAGTMVLPFLTLYLTLDKRLPAAKAGLALTVYGIASIIIAPLAGRLSDRLGGLRIIKLSLLSSGVMLIGLSLMESFTLILAFISLWAIASEAFRPPSMAIIGELAGRSDRKAAFALYRLAINLGMSIGPVVGGLLAMRSFKLLFYVDGATALLAALLLSLVPWRSGQGRFEPDADLPGADESLDVADVTDGGRPRSYLGVLTDRRLVYFLVAMIPIELVFFQSLAAMPLFLVRDLQMTEAGFGALLAINAVIIIILEVPLNAAMADWPHRHALALGALLIGSGFGALALIDSVPGAAITVVIWTFGEMIFLPASGAYVSDIAPRDQAGAYMGLYTMGFSVALAVGPWLGTRLLEDYGPLAVWGGTFGCGCITTVMMWFLREQPHRHPVENR